MSDTARMIPSYVSTRTRTRWLAGLLMGTAIAGWFAVGFDVAELRLLARQVSGAEIPRPELLSHAWIRQTLSALQALLVAGAAAAFVTWIYVARRNLRALGVRRLRFSTLDAVLGCVIPGLNLVRPYQVMREIWCASDPDVTDPLAWKQAPVAPLLPLWWGAVLAFAVLALGTTAMEATAGRSLPRQQVSLVAELVTDVAAAIVATLSYFVAVRIGTAQEEKVEAVRGASADPERAFLRVPVPR